MKKLILGIFLSILGVSSYAQGTIQLTVRWNTSLTRYEVYAKPSFTANSFPWGTSQISVVTPSSSPDQSLTITSVAAGSWTDNSKVFNFPASQPVNDFHGVESSGSAINLVANTESLIFTFTFPDGICRDGIRLFINNTDPSSSVNGMQGGDFRNTIYNAVLQDVYSSNYENTGTVCVPCNIIAPELSKQ